MSSVYLLTLRQLSSRGRLLIMVALAAMPVLIAMPSVWSARAATVEEFEVAVLSTMFAGAILPLVVLAVASAAFANEVEDRTLANLTLAPIARWRIVAGKVLAAVTVAGPFMVGSAFITSDIAFAGDVVATMAVTVSAVIGVAMYASAFTWLGLVTTQAIGFGLAYIVLWEGFFAGFVSGVRFLSIGQYAIAWMHGLDARRFATGDHVGFGLAVAAAVVVCGGFFLLAVRRLRRMDVP